VELLVVLMLLLELYVVRVSVLMSAMLVNWFICLIGVVGEGFGVDFYLFFVVDVGLECL